MRTVTNILSIAGMLGCWYFVVAYHITTGGDWRHSAAGRHVMQFTATLGALMALIVTARIWGDWPGRQLVAMALYAALVVQVWWRVVLLHQAQRPDRHPEDATTPRGGPQS